MVVDSYDFIVVGGGTAGCVLAARLSENPNFQVLMIEAGEDQDMDPRVFTPAMWPTLIKSPLDWAYDTVPQNGLGSRNIPFPMGRLLGGTSAINSLTFSPIPKSTVEGWADLGNPGWDWPAFSQSLKKVYTLTGKNGSGPIQLSYPDWIADSPWGSGWKNTLTGLGLSVSDDLFTGQGNGMIVNPETIHPETRQRSSAHSSYLAPVLHRQNLTVLTGAVVDKIIFSPRSYPAEEAIAKGIQYIKNSQTMTIHARKDVIVASGTINSPMLLERSGVGSADLLGKMGIDVVVDNPNVGENMQNHIILTISTEAQPGMPTFDAIARQEPEALAAAAKEYQETQSGPFATSGVSFTGQLPYPNINTEAGKRDLDNLLSTTLNIEPGTAFYKAHTDFVRSMISSPEEATGVYVTFPGFIQYDPEAMAGPSENTEPKTYLSIGIFSTHPLSRGSTHITSPSPSDGSTNYGTAIDPGYLTHPLDLEIFARNLRFMDKILASEPLASQLKPGGGKRALNAPPIGGFENLEFTKEYIRKHATGGCHFVGTCSMMPREMGGVVDPKLRVYGTKNLRVCDASVIPLIPRANPQAAVYGVAEHCVGFILAEYA